MSGCLKNDHKVEVILGTHTQLQWFLPTHTFSLFKWQHVLFCFGWKKLFLRYQYHPSNIADPTFHRLTLLYMFTGCDVTSFFLILSKLGLWKDWSKNDLIKTMFIKLKNAAEEDDFINKKLLLTNVTKSSQSCILKVSQKQIRLQIVPLRLYR